MQRPSSAQPNDYWGLSLEPAVFHALGSFGGGLGCGSVCGALAGSAAVLGILSTRTVAHENPLLRPTCSLLVRTFRERFGSEQCRELLPVHKREGERCLQLVEQAAGLLEELVEAHGLAAPWARESPHRNLSEDGQRASLPGGGRDAAFLFK